LPSEPVNRALRRCCGWNSPDRNPRPGGGALGLNIVPSGKIGTRTARKIRRRRRPRTTLIGIDLARAARRTRRDGGRINGPDVLDRPTLCLDDVLCTEELRRRPPRRPEHAAEKRALAALAETMAHAPRTILQKLADTALDLCRADSAGVSILEPGTDRGMFRWHSVAGRLAVNAGRRMPRDASPCGTVFDRDAALLFAHPERHFDDSLAVAPPLVETLMIPFRCGDKPVGTIWVVAHTEDRQFDAEDARLLGSLSQFASANYQMIRAVDAAEAGRAELEWRVVERTRELSDANEALRDSKERLQRTLSAARIGISSWDVAADTQTRDANLNRLLGLEMMATKQPSGEFLDCIHSDDRAVVAFAFDACAKRHRPVNVDFRVVWPDGAVRWLRYQGGFSGGPEDGTAHVVGAVVDITDLMEAEEALQRARKELEDRVTARVSDVARAQACRTYEAALRAAEAAARLARTAIRSAQLADTPRSAQAAARLAASTSQAARRALKLIGVCNPLKSPASAHDWIEAIWTEVRRAIVATEEEQRRRISRELHDQLGQACASLIIGLATLEARLPQGSDASGPLEWLLQLAHRIDDDLHRIALELRPTALDDLGLHVTLLNLAEEWGEQTGVVVDYSSQGLEHRRLPAEVETAVFRIVQEALTNVQKHAAAGRVGLILALRGDDLVVIIEDDGDGCDPETAIEAAEAAGRLGMRGMRERAALVGGDLEVESTPGNGTTVFLRITLRPGTGVLADA
jgi:PAS domain S-box-containing protein